MPAFRIFAKRQLRRGVDERTGEPLYFAMGEEIPAEQFGSGQALMAAEHRGYISVVPVIAPTEDAEAARATPPHQARAARTDAAKD